MTWLYKLGQYRTAVEAARIVMDGFDTSSAAPGEKEKDLLNGISLMCQIAIARINECNELYKKETAVIDND